MTRFDEHITGHLRQMGYCALNIPCLLFKASVIGKTVFENRFLLDGDHLDLGL